MVKQRTLGRRGVTKCELKKAHTVVRLGVCDACVRPDPRPRITNQTRSVQLLEHGRLEVIKLLLEGGVGLACPRRRWFGRTRRSVQACKLVAARDLPAIVLRLDGKHRRRRVRKTVLREEAFPRLSG
jgi:hypothetical protein